MNKKTQLIKVLLDRNEDLAVRDDCAMDLAAFNDEDTLKALYECGSDPNENYIIQASCGESLAEIMVRISCLEKQYIVSLSNSSKSELKEYFSAQKPEWISEV